MRCVVFMNGRRLGDFGYDLPRDERGREVAAPSPSREGYPEEVDVVFRGPNDEMWLVRGRVERLG